MAEIGFQGLKHNRDGPPQDGTVTTGAIPSIRTPAVLPRQVNINDSACLTVIRECAASRRMPHDSPAAKAQIHQIDTKLPLKPFDRKCSVIQVHTLKID